MSKYWCYKGKHFQESKKFTKSQLTQTSMICKECVKKEKKDYWRRKQREKEEDSVFDNMFFNFKGL